MAAAAVVENGIARAVGHILAVVAVVGGIDPAVQRTPAVRAVDTPAVRTPAGRLGTAAVAVTRGRCDNAYCGVRYDLTYCA